MKERLSLQRFRLVGMLTNFAAKNNWPVDKNCVLKNKNRNKKKSQSTKGR